MSDEILELLEGVSSANNAFIKSEIALNNGEVEDSQKYSKEGQILLFCTLFFINYINYIYV